MIFFSFVLNKHIFILLVDILYFQIYKYYIYIYIYIYKNEASKTPIVFHINIILKK